MTADAATYTTHHGPIRVDSAITVELPRLPLGPVRTGRVLVTDWEVAGKNGRDVIDVVTQHGETLWVYADKVRDVVRF